jgi:hypothetical protein
MDLLRKQRDAVADHIRLENEHRWADVPPTLVQDDRAFFDFVPVGQFNGAEGVRQLYQTIAGAFPGLHIESPLLTMSQAAPFAKDSSAARI